MPTINKIATVFTSPAPSLGGSALGSGDVNGHGFVQSLTSRIGNGDSQVNRSGDWNGFQKPPGIIKSIRLKFDWEYDMNLSYTVSGGAPGSGGSFGLIESDYSLNGGSSWSLAGSAFALQSIVNTDNSLNFHGGGSENIVIPASTPFGQIRVRDICNAQVQISGDDGGSSGNSEVQYRMQNIRLEVVFLPSNFPVMVN